MLYYLLLGLSSGILGAIIVFIVTPRKLKASWPESDKLIHYCNAKVIKENYRNGDYFNYLKYELNDTEENSRFLNMFDDGEEVEIIIKRK